MSLLNFLETKGYQPFEPSLLIPADLVRAVSGEDVNAKLFITTAADGEELCLRHDFTLPITLHVLQTGLTRADFSYSGKVFRNNQGEKHQAGIESYGRFDRMEADAEVIELALKGAKGDLKLNDISLVLNLIESLNLPLVHKRAVTKAFRRSKKIELRENQTTYSGVLTALEGADPKAARALVGDLLKIAGISTFGGRSVNEIADRFLEQASLDNSSETRDKFALIDKVLQIKGKPDAALTAFNKLAPQISLTEQTKIAALDAEFDFSFAREPDYYDGLVFEINHETKRLVGGGRYDRMVEILALKIGKSVKIPAVGCAFLERIDQ